MGSLGDSIADHGQWRREVARVVQRYAGWLSEVGLSDPSIEARVARICERLASERITIAFVAEFSRGKSELINAIFFGGYGRRMLPSAAGRTTMCPTEILYDRARPASVRLLPIETRLGKLTLSELRKRDAEWIGIEVDPADPDGLAAALASVRETIDVDPAQAALLGLHDPDDPQGAALPDADGRIAIPRWRHAIVNYPHPLLELGLVILDTPGLNAMGAEPDLSFRLIPAADAVLFVLAADVGVTRSDIEVWREHVSASHGKGRFVVLNRIDALWDGIRDDVQIQIEIARQVGSVARELGLPNERIFPVSAQKALAARIRGDASLLRRSRITDLEYALGRELVPQQREIAREHVEREFGELHAQACADLGARLRNAVEQLVELQGLRGKSRGVLDHAGARIRREREDFERSLRRLQAMRAVLARQSEALGRSLGGEALRRRLRDARDAMLRSSFSLGLREEMDTLLDAVRADFGEAGRIVDEATALMGAMYRVFNDEHGMALGAPVPYPMHRFLDELERVAQLQRRRFGALTLATTSQKALMRSYFESVALRLREIQELAEREVQAWLRAVMTPIETQAREHQEQFRRRLESVRRVLAASDGLEGRIAEIERERAEAEQRVELAAEFGRQVRQLLGEPVQRDDFAAVPPSARLQSGR